MKETFSYIDVVDRLAEKYCDIEKHVISVCCFSYIQRHVYSRLGNSRINCLVFYETDGFNTIDVSSYYYTIPIEDLRDNLSQLVDEIVETVIRNIYLKGKFTTLELESCDTCIISMVPYVQIKEIRNKPKYDIIDITNLCRAVNIHLRNNGLILQNDDLLSIMSSSLKNIFEYVGRDDHYALRLSSLLATFENADHLGLSDYKKAACLIDVYFLYRCRFDQNKIRINNVDFPFKRRKYQDIEIKLSVVRVGDDKWNLHYFTYKV